MSKFNYLIWFCALISGPLFMDWLLERKVQARFKKFDSDYPQMLMSLVGLLKTGMNPMNALDSCADGLEINSTVRTEIKLMVERLRFGVTEDKSIGAFAEDIFHPEKELFVQALLLSRRVGGTLSHTLERLSKQARKRQYFRQSAQAAVGMQRGSINFIVAILAALEVYVYFVYPEVIEGALSDPLGWQVYQTGVFVVLLGMYWVRQVTKIKI
jgi:tight adherence protein B